MFTNNNGYFYKQSDLWISSDDIKIVFYHKHIPENEFPVEKYSSAVILSSQSKIGSYALFPFIEDEAVLPKLFFYCLDGREKYEELNDLLVGAGLYFENDKKVKIPEPALCEKETTVLSFVQTILESDNICISFGAGISAGYVPTLVEFFNSLELVKITSDDCATNESMQNFVLKFLSNSKCYCDNIRNYWHKVFETEVHSTPAHIALLKITQVLKNMGKNVFVYTDNVDGIHNKVGLEISEQETEEMTQIKLPLNALLENRKTTVLVCGQSFDFHRTLSSLETRKKIVKNLEFFSLNINRHSIVVFDEFDFEHIQPGRNIFTDFQPKSLDMTYLSGSCHEVLPEISQKLHYCYNAENSVSKQPSTVQWMKNLFDHTQYENFCRLYNQKYPNAERDGYGPSAIVSYKSSF